MLPKDQIKDVFAKNERGRKVLDDLISEAEAEWEDYERAKREWEEEF